jgi:hypothetical protein
MKSSQITTLDNIFSEIIRLRANGYCEHCGLWVGFDKIDPSHYLVRANKNLRWDEDNVFGLKHECHMYFDNHKSEFTSWIVTRLGIERFDRLVLKHTTIQKLDYITIKTQLQTRLNELKEIRG